MGETMRRKSLVEQHVERCIELYGMPCDVDYGRKRVERGELEQIRADLMIAIGMLSALEKITPSET